METRVDGSVHSDGAVSVGIGRITDKVILIVRSQLLREGLRRMLEEVGFEVTSVASTPAELLKLRNVCTPQRTDLILIEGWFCTDNASFLDQIQEVMPKSSIILLADNDYLHKLKSSVLERVSGIFSIQTSGKVFTQAVRELPGKCLVTLDFIHSLLKRVEELEGAVGVEPMLEEQPPSRREAEILGCLVDGCSNKVIARQLGITEATVKVHLKGLLRKIRASNRTQAAIWALNNGISAESVVRLKRLSQSGGDAASDRAS